MTIEVKQLLVKSMVTQGEPVAPEQGVAPVALEEWKEELLRECRRMIESRLSEAEDR